MYLMAIGMSLYGAGVGYFLGRTPTQAMFSFIGFFAAALIFSKIKKRVFEFPLEVVAMIVLLSIGMLLDYSNLIIFNTLFIVALQVVIKHMTREKV